MKKDLVKIYQKIGDELSDKNLNKENKIFYVKILSKHFNNNTNEYFLNIINNTYYDNINYRNYLKCLPMKNITNIYANIHKNNKDEPEHISKSFKSSKSDSNIIPEIKYDIVDIPKNISVVSKLFKSSKKTYIKPKKIEKIYNEDIDIDYLPFNTKRVSDNKFEEKLNKIINKYKKKKSNIIKYIMRLSQLFLDDIIIMNDIYYKPIKIKIINVLYINVETLLYIGEVIEGTTKGSKVVVKIQPKIPDKFEYRKIDIKYQITTEHYIMKLLNINCANAIVSKVYAYGSIGKLVDGDIGRYVLVSKLLGKDLRQLRGDRDISKIKRIFILILRALQSMHNCNLKKNISIIHLDIKPHNIVFANENINEIKIIDFGLSENIINAKGVRQMKVYKGYVGTVLYMATMMYKKYIIDYMLDLQSLAWVLFDVLCDNNILANRKEKKNSRENVYYNKMLFINNYRNAEYIKTIESCRVTANNITVVGEIVEYTIDRANKPNRYHTDKKNADGVFYCDYNDAYYNDIEMLLNRLS